jgi:hypothetical protein
MPARAPQIDQRRWVGHRLERGQMQLAALIDGRGAVPTQPRRHLPVGGVQGGRVVGEQRCRLGRQAQRVHAGLAGAFPRLAREQLVAGITPPRR